MNDKEQEKDDAKAPPGKSIADAIHRLLHRLRDVEFTCRTSIPLAAKQKASELAADKLELTKLTEVMNSARPGGLQPLMAPIITTLFRVLRRLDRLQQSNITSTLSRSLFIGSFGIFDAFIGDLIAAIFKMRPVLLKSLGGSTTIADVLSTESLEDFKNTVIDSEVDSLRRESYPDQFDRLEKLFNVTLRKFERWPDFIEAGQRRNLITHCDGIVSIQYLQICRKHGIDVSGINMGDALEIELAYLVRSCEILREVAVKLTHTLWRKILPEQLEECDKDLNTILYGGLHLEEWDWTIILGNFAVHQPRFSNELYKRMMIINYAQAWHHKGDTERARDILADYDWSASSLDLKLAYRIINDDFAEAARLMKAIGRKSELLEEHCYHDWPLFRDFRSSEDFLNAYEAVYGYPFTKTVLEVAESAEKTGSAIAENTELPAPPMAD